jgi:cyanophycin synthetase
MPQLLDKSIKILNIKHIRGPNMWCWTEVLEALVDIGELEDYPSNKIPGFYERLVKTLPSLVEHRCSYEEHGGFLRRVEEGTWPVHIMEHLTLELQGLAGYHGGFGRARDGASVGVYKLIVATPHEAVTQKAIYIARDLLLALIQDRPYDLDSQVDELKELMDDLCLGPSTSSIVQAAAEKGVPHIRLSKGNLVQLGYGAAQKRIWTAETDKTSAIAETISRDKDLTKSLLAAVGVPTPQGQLVDSAQHAWEIAQDIGLPVVIKPQDGNHGRGVFTNLQTQHEIQAAFDVAQHEGSGVLVEKFIVGDEHRLLVVGDRLIAAAKGEACQVCGDGVHTIDELIQLQINSDPRRGPTEDFPLNPVRIDSMAVLELKSQGFTAESVPKKDQEVLVQRNGNVAFDVTELVHPSVAKKVVLAAKVVGLDIAGIDLVARDISRPMEEQGAAIVEVNAGPGLLMHIKPANGKPQPVGQAIVEHLFPQGHTSRIPLIGVCGPLGGTVVSEICAYFLKLSNYYVALSNHHGLSFNQRVVDISHHSEWELGHRAILNPMVEAAVIEASAYGILMEGLPYDRCSVGIITEIDRQQFFPEQSITDERQLFSLYRTQIDVVLNDGLAVINADDPLAQDLIDVASSPYLVLSIDQDNALIQASAQNGLRNIIQINDQIVLRTGFDIDHSFSMKDAEFFAPHTNSEKVRWMMAAIAAAWATGIPFATIDTGIQTFMPEELAN